MTAHSRLRNVAAMLIAATFCALPTSLFAAAPAELYKQAADHFTAGRWTESAAEFRKLITETEAAAGDAAASADPATRQLVGLARFYLSESLIRSDRSAEAIDVLKPLLADTAGAAELDPALLAIARYRLGEAHYLADQTSEARAAFQAYVDAATASGTSTATMPRVVFYLGDLATRAGDHTAAAEWHGRFTATYPDDELFTTAAARHVEAFLKSEQFLAAWTAVRGQYQAADSAPSFALLAAEASAGLDRFDDAAKAYDRYLTVAGEADAERDRALYASAWNLRKLARNADAAARFDELVRTQPKSRYRADAAYRAAEYYFEQSQFDEALKRVREARTTADADLLPFVLNIEFQTALALNDRPAAEAVLAMFVAKCPTHEIAQQADYWKAELAYRAEAWDEAAEQFSALITSAEDKRSPWYAAAVGRHIEALAQAGRWAETIVAVAAARIQLPGSAESFQWEYLAGRAHAARAEFREAREAYVRVLADEKSKGTETALLAQFMNAESYLHQRDYTTALAEYEKVLAQNGFAEWRAAGRLQAGKCLEQLGRRTEAMAHYDRLLAESADSPYAADAARRREAVLQQAEAPAGNVQRK
jgi:tetratricopeptide (TPR) repeat protein